MSAKGLSAAFILYDVRTAYNVGVCFDRIDGISLRALNYGAVALEGGFGFVQYFIHPYRRCAQDRLAETIVVTERSYQQKFPVRLGTPSEGDTLPR